MRHLTTFFKRLYTFLRREKIFQVLTIVGIVILLGSVGFVYFEPDMEFLDALWWSIVTLTTVGYGDISPTSGGGRLVGMGVMVLGIGFLGILTASIASAFIEERLLENKGMKPTEVTDHFLICGWSSRGPEIVSQMRADPKYSKSPIVVIADLPEKPMDDPDLYFVRGEVSTENLKRARIQAARVVMVLSDDRLDAYSRDAKAVLNTLTIESLNPKVYTCVELMDPKNVEYCQMAHADEIIVVGELSTNLMVQAALDHGITRMVSELVSNRYGEDLYKIELPPRLVGQPFYDVLCELKQNHNVLCIGIEDPDGRNLMTNPKTDYVTRAEDRLIVIATDRPEVR